MSLVKMNTPVHVPSLCFSLLVLYHEILEEGMKEFHLFLNSQLFNINPQNIHNHFDLGQAISQYVTNERYMQKTQTVVSGKAEDS